MLIAITSILSSAARRRLGASCPMRKLFCTAPALVATTRRDEGSLAGSGAVKGSSSEDDDRSPNASLARDSISRKSRSPTTRNTPASAACPAGCSPRPSGPAQAGRPLDGHRSCHPGRSRRCLEGREPSAAEPQVGDQVVVGAAQLAQLTGRQPHPRIVRGRAALGEQLSAHPHRHQPDDEPAEGLVCSTPARPSDSSAAAQRSIRSISTPHAASRAWTVRAAAASSGSSARGSPADPVRAGAADVRPPALRRRRAPRAGSRRAGRW